MTDLSSDKEKEVMADMAADLIETKLVFCSSIFIRSVPVLILASFEQYLSLGVYDYTYS